MGWIFTSFLLGYVLFMIPGGWLADWLGGKRTLVVSGAGDCGARRGDGIVRIRCHSGLGTGGLHAGPVSDGSA